MNSLIEQIDHTWTLFLDRDGVINERLIDTYVKTIDEFKFIEGSKEAIVYFSKIFNHIFVVTNQQGIGKGYMTERNLFEVHDYMTKEIEKSGGQITAIFFAPQLASENSDYRKPNTGMGLKAKELYPSIDFNKCIMIGDSNSDIEFGKKLGMITVKIGEELSTNENADYNCKSLVECIKLLKL